MTVSGRMWRVHCLSLGLSLIWNDGMFEVGFQFGPWWFMGQLDFLT